MPNSEPLPTQSTEELHSQLSQNLLFHAILEQEAQTLRYGQISVNVELKDGVAILETLNIVLNQRIKY